jgi:hypothetical protein
MNDWSEIVGWLATGGAVAVVAWFASWFLEGFAWWEKVSSQLKSLVILLIALLIGLAATWVRLLPPEVVAPFIPYANMVVLTVVAWLGSQVAHRADGRGKTLNHEEPKGSTKNHQE